MAPALHMLSEKVMKGSEMKFWFLKIESEVESLGITIKWLKMELKKFDLMMILQLQLVVK